MTPTGDECETFADLASRPAANHGCRKCGAPADGVIYIQARAYGAKRGSLKGGQVLTSLSRSYCESCLVVTFQKAEAQLKGERDV